LFGGGITLANGFSISGLSNWIGSQFYLLKEFNLILVLIIIITCVNFLTEITSNMATTSVVLPILIPLALVLNVNPIILMTGATISASCAYMLPVATPPNAIVFGSNLLKISDMIRVGFWMNIVSIVIITIITYFFVPIIFYGII
jgi:sodium-dependent dicarboxylate transporter 2/3/5